MTITNITHNLMTSQAFSCEACGSHAGFLNWHNKFENHCCEVMYYYGILFTA